MGEILYCGICGAPAAFSSSKISLSRAIDPDKEMLFIDYTSRDTYSSTSGNVLYDFKNNNTITIYSTTNGSSYCYTMFEMNSDFNELSRSGTFNYDYYLLIMAIPRTDI